MDILPWLLDSDPAIRWQVMRDLTDAPPEEVAAERARIAAEGWGARLLALQDPEGTWAGGAYNPGNYDWNAPDRIPGQPWTATMPTLQLLYEIGIDPSDRRVREAIEKVRMGCKWEWEGLPFFDGEVEPCVNGRTVAIGAYFGQAVTPIVEQLLDDQMEDGGWNCEQENGSVRSSFHSTICVLEGLLEYERSTGGTADTVAARRRGEEYLLERQLFRRKSTGEIVKAEWLQFSHPVHWHYDVLRALDYFRATGAPPDPRLSEAIDLLRSRQQPDGTWLLENTHPGDLHFVMEEPDGTQSRWNTLRALRVLHWVEQAGQ